MFILGFTYIRSTLKFPGELPDKSKSKPEAAGGPMSLAKPSENLRIDDRKTRVLLAHPRIGKNNGYVVATAP